MGLGLKDLPDAFGIVPFGGKSQPILNMNHK